MFHSGSELNVLLTPLGATFNQGVQGGGAQSSINTAAISDLSLTLIDVDGESVIAMADSNGAGIVESIDAIVIPEAGEYFVRIAGAGDVVQFYELSLSLREVTQLVGDYDGDGVVGPSDYIVWINSLGDSGAGLPADGNGDGVINQPDYDLWRTNFGRSSAGGGVVAIPEPGTFLLIVCGSVLVPVSMRSQASCSTTSTYARCVVRQRSSNS